MGQVCVLAYLPFSCLSGFMLFSDCVSCKIHTVYYHIVCQRVAFPVKFLRKFQAEGLKWQSEYNAFGM